MQLHKLPIYSTNQDYYWNVWSWILPFIFFSIHILNHIIVFCWKVSIVTHARCLAAHWLHSEWPWTRGILAGSEWAWASHPTKTASVCFLCRKTYCDIRTGDNLWIYGAAVNGNFNAAPTHTLTFNGIHQPPCYQQILGPQVYIYIYIYICKEVVHTAEQHWIELPMMQFIIIHSFIYFLTPRSELCLIF